MMAIIKTLSSAVKMTSFPLVSDWLKHNGQGLPVSTGATFGWLSACRVAKTPVGRISASRSRELSVSPTSAFSLTSFGKELDHVEESSRSNKVPPALGTRTNCAWPPSSAGDPKRYPSGHLPVYPRRQTLRTPNQVLPSSHCDLTFVLTDTLHSSR